VARSVFGDSDVLRLERHRVETAQAERRAYEKLEASLARAAALLEDERFTEVLDLLSRDEAAAGGDAELDARAAELRRAAKKGVARVRKAQEETAAVSRVETCLEDGELQQARRALGMARKLDASSDALDRLEQRLEEAEEDRQLAEVADLVGRAREAADAGNLEKAARILKEGEARFPENLEIAHYLDSIRRREAEAAIHASLEAGDLKAAERGLRLAEKLFGADERFVELRRRLEELQSA